MTTQNTNQTNDTHFKKFTNKFSLTKTLRFELIPELTQEELEEIKNEKGYSSINEVTRQDRTEYFLHKSAIGSALRERDTERDKAFKLFKRLVTEMHRMYLENTLSALSQNSEIKELLKNLVVYLKEFSNLDKNNDKHKEQISGLIRKINTTKKEIAEKLKEPKGLLCKEDALCLFDKKIAWKHLVGKGGANEDLAKLLESVSEEQIRQEFQDVLADDEQLTFKIGDEEKTVFAVFAGWKTYCKPFYDIRLNAYKGDGYETEGSDEKIITGNHGQVITRVLDDNADIFAQNYNRIEKQFSKEHAKEELQKIIATVDGATEDILMPSGYINALSQSGIDTYNKVVAEVNSYLNRRFGKKASFLKKLYKQILGRPEGEKYDPFIEIVTLDELQDYLWEKEDERFDNKSFINYALDKLKSAKFDFAEILDDTNKQVIANDEVLREIVLDVNQLSRIANTLFGSWAFLRELFKEAAEIAEENNDGDLKELTKKFLLDKETTLYDLKKVIELEKDDGDGNKKPLLDPQEMIEAIKQGPFNFPQEFIDQLSNEDTLFNLLKAIAEYQKTLREGRKWHTAKEVKMMQEKGEVCDEKSCAEHKSLIQLFEEVSKFSEEYIKEGKKPIAQSTRKKYMQLLNTLFDRFNALNRFATLFIPGLENTEDYITDTMKTAVQLNPRGNNINKMFNAVRNYATKQAVVEDKIKLTFEESSLANGWGYNTTDYRVRLLRKDKNYYLAVIPTRSNVNRYYAGEHRVNPKELSEYEILLYYQLKSKTFFGSTWRGMVNEREDENIPTSYKETLKRFGIEKTNIIIGDLLLQKSIEAGFVDQYKEKFTAVIEKINNGFYDYYLAPEKFLQEFENKYGYSFKGRTAGITKPEKVNQALGLLEELLPTELFKHVPISYWRNKLEQTGEKSIIKDGVVGTYLLVYDISLLEPYWYFSRWVPVSGYNVENESIRQLYQKAVSDLEDAIIFKLYSKDFSPYKQTNKYRDLQTVYWDSVLASEEDTPINQLSGGAEIFFREALPESEREKVTDDELKNPKTSKKPYRKRRFTQDKILFHVPIELNRISEGRFSINSEIADYFASQENGDVIGVDRGEKHLAYYCRLHSDGTIAECESLNDVGERKLLEKGTGEIVDNGPIPYQKILDQREKARLDARRTWGMIEQIKDLKKGYISQVVRKLADMIVEHDAMLAMENLNHGFKQGRTRIEKNVYQQLENALLNKLQYFVREKTQEGVQNALQLVGNIGPQYAWGTQMGVVFYTDAKFTSRTCPHCGWRKRGVDYLAKAKKFKEHINNGGFKIFWERDKERFRIEYTWSYKQKVDGKEIEVNSGEILGGDGFEVIYSDVDRSYWNAREHKVLGSNPTNMIKEAFRGDVDWDNLAPDENIVEYIEHYGKLAKTLSKTLMNLRFDDPERGEDDSRRDVLQCPKCHFDTRNPEKVAPHLAKITNADAVGAYNIARRGLMIKNKLKKGKRGSGELKITLKEWDEYTYKDIN